MSALDFPDLPGGPIEQAAVLAEWAAARPELPVSDAGLDLWDALHHETGRWGTSAYQCREWAREYNAGSQTLFRLSCSDWAAGVQAALDAVLAAVADFIPGAAETLSSASSGAAAQVAAIDENWAQFRRDLGRSGARVSAGFLVLSGIVVALLLRGRS